MRINFIRFLFDQECHHIKMTAKIVAIILTGFCLTGCDKDTKPGHGLMNEKSKPQITESDIYSILEYIIAERKLSKDYGINIEPADRCDPGKDDREFLTGLISATEPKDSLVDSGHLIIKIPLGYDFGLPKCLTKENVDFMLHQKEMNKGFKWNNSKLGFNLDNHDNWYEFSVPLFSEDKTKAILIVSNLCKGLCGTQQTFLVETNSDARTFKTGYHYIH
jgi:hypothetical protein